MKTYNQLKNTWMQDEMSKLFKKYKVFFAFSDKQLQEGKKKHNISENESLSRIVSGGIVPTKNKKAFHNDFATLHNELVKKIKKLNSDEVIESELANYESYYTGNIDTAFEVLEEYGYTRNQVLKVYRDTFDKNNEGF